MEIQKVIEHANQLLTEARYTKSRIYAYNWLWKKGILSYMNSKSLVDFDEKVGKECTLCFHDGGTVTFYHRDLIKSIDVLVNVFLNDNVGKMKRTPTQYPFRGEIGSAAQDYFEFLKLLLGHANLSTTMVYLDITTDMEAKAMISLEDEKTRDMPRKWSKGKDSHSDVFGRKKIQ